MSFHSILFNNAKDQIETETLEPPDFFSDLNLDQLIEAITAGKPGYNLKPFFFTPLSDPKTIQYRHEVMRDVEDTARMAYIKTFTERMSTARRYLTLTNKLEFNYHKKGWFLEAALIYCEAVIQLAQNLSRGDFNSRGFQALHDHVSHYVQTQGFKSLREDAHEVKAGLSKVQYSVITQVDTVKVKKYEGEPDYSKEVEKTFEKFKQGAVKDYLVDLPEGSGMNHIEAQILDFVAQLYPEQFAALDRFYQQHNRFVDDTIRIFEREIQFYIAYLDFIANFKRKGLPFCYPQITTTSREVYAEDTFDLALAHVLQSTNEPVVVNDFSLKEPERIIVVSGPNQGGKTTFARMFGQLHYLASLGCPVPGRKAKLYLPDHIYVHFERQEDIRNMRGKLQDDLVRIHEILDRATPGSILIVNEIFASTTLKDAVFLSKAIMERILELDLLGVWVTFIDELSSMSEKTISMVSTVVPENPAERTFKIVRKPADGLAYAISIAEKHRLTYEALKERIRS